MRAWISGDTTSSIRLKPASGLRIRDLADNAVWTLPVTSSTTQWSIEPYGNHLTQLQYVYAPSNRWIAFSGRSVFKGDGAVRGFGPEAADHAKGRHSAVPGRAACSGPQRGRPRHDQRAALG
jgi:hypothetical protein